MWSTGIRIPEHSILNAYIELIGNAQKFVYIENQFFMSNAGGESVIQNGITKALTKRIIKAHKNHEYFKVYIFIPLLPGFEGNILEKGSEVLKLQVKFQQETINKGPTSLQSSLKRERIEMRDYVRFFGLRQHDVFNNGPGQEMIYIHSKCLIVDDRAVIIGSANINDRSMLGTRDSEVCILIKDEDTIDSEMGGEPFKVGKTPHEFRCRLLAEHIGAEDPEECKDPIAEDFFNFFVQRSEHNTDLYRELFRAEPDDHQSSFENLKKDRDEYAAMGSAIKYDKYKELKDEIIGHIVNYPTNYMSEETLDLKFTDVENLVPKINFT